MVSSLHASPNPGLKCFGGLARLWNVFGPFSSFCAFEMHASPAVLVAEIATEVLQGPPAPLPRTARAHLGVAKKRLLAAEADSGMLGYANLAKAWRKAKIGSIDPILGMVARVRRASQKKQSGGGNARRLRLRLRRPAGQQGGSKPTPAFRLCVG